MAEKNIAVLDDQRRLVGYRRGVPGFSDVVVPDNCDLPTTGLYVWEPDIRQFRPLGHGHPKVTSRPPISTERALYLLFRGMADIERAANVSVLGADLRDWASWYEETLRARDDEAVEARRIRRGGGR
jgi:hypothetical protein